MLADGNHDRRMDDSESDSDQLRLTTPTHPTVLPNALSPPDSQQRSRMATAASGSNIANSNGKRPLQTTGNGPDDMGEPPGMAPVNGKARADLPVKTHAASGYTYSRPEDEPGYAWLNKKALDEYSRTWEHLQHKDCMVKNRYGDMFAMVENERARLGSLG